MPTFEEVIENAWAARRSGDYPGAVRHGKLATELDGSNPRGWLMLAESFFLWERVPEARAAAENGLRHAPTDASLWRTKATGELAEGDKDAGLDSLRRAAECDPIHAFDYLEALVEFSRYSEAERQLAALRERATMPVDIEELDRVEATLIHDQVLSASWVEVGTGDNGEPLYLPTSYGAIQELQDAIHRIESLGGSDAVQAIASNAQAAVDDQLTRRYGGGWAIPIAALVLGGLMIASADGNQQVMLIGGGYLLSAGLYLHAARVQTYRINVRLARGETGGGGFVGEMATGKDFSERFVGLVMGFTCLGVFAPLVVLYHYVRNYLFK